VRTDEPGSTCQHNTLGMGIHSLCFQPHLENKNSRNCGARARWLRGVITAA